MGFRFQRRINLGGGWGLNTSGSGGSLSYRSRHGSIGTRGFSLRTGIPGLSYRQNWGKNAGGAAAVIMAVLAALTLAAIAIKILIYALPIIWNCLRWLLLTIYDLCTYTFQQMKLRQTIARDLLIGAVVCGAVSLLMIYPRPITVSNAPPITASMPIEPPTAVQNNPIATPHRTKVAAPTAAEGYDDLGRVRSTNPESASRIESYCSPTPNKMQTSAEDEGRCRRSEMAAWLRIYRYNEFRTLSPQIQRNCETSLQAASYVEVESCMRTAVQ